MRHARAAPAERLRLSVLLALLLHAAALLGIGVMHHRPPARAPALDVTLALQHDDQASPDTELLAQFSQRGSGIERDANDPTVPVVGSFEAAIVQPAFTPMAGAPREATSVPLLETRHSEEVSSTPPTEESGYDQPMLPDTPQHVQTTSEIATLLARLDAQRQAYAKMPRIERLTSAATREAADAAYLFAWKQRVEAIGNEHYPIEAKRRRLYGELRLLVALRPDGSVIETRVLQSSGHELLDNAAVQIVRLAAPFNAFPAAIAARADRLEIIRTWQFRANRLSAND